MNPKTVESFTEEFKKAHESVHFWTHFGILKFTEDILSRLESDGLSHTELAKRMGVSPAFVTKLINGKNNFTLRTMVRVALALGCETHVELREMNADARWRNYEATKSVELVLPAAFDQAVKLSDFHIVAAPTDHDHADISLAA
jgi:plasmid maintenance system antidote protein VapI